MGKEIKVGVIGVFRGESFVRSAADAGMKLVALCDNREDKLSAIDVGDSVVRYTDYDEFLTHDMDAVILANFFHEHQPFAIKALKAGKHVMSETVCNFTVAEGVELCEAVEDSGLVYMLAENYPFAKFNQELRRLYRSGALGEVTYAEGEYNHPISEEDYKPYVPSPDHWRAWLPRGYYCTHALAPLMYITDLMPKKVSGFEVTPTQGGWAAMLQMDSGAVFRLIGGGMPGHSNFYRIHGTKGAAEITRGPGYFGPEQVRVWYDEWEVPAGTPRERTYIPEWPENAHLAKAAERSGHAGADFWCDYFFAEAIRTSTQPFLDVYRGVAMSTVGILMNRSMKSGSIPIEIPDFKDKENRERFKNDTARLGPENII
jgi:predicted dehydrogenase